MPLAALLLDVVDCVWPGSASAVFVISRLNNGQEDWALLGRLSFSGMWVGRSGRAPPLELRLPSLALMRNPGLPMSLTLNVRTTTLDPVLEWFGVVKGDDC